MEALVSKPEKTVTIACDVFLYMSKVQIEIKNIINDAHIAASCQPNSWFSVFPQIPTSENVENKDATKAFNDVVSTRRRF